MNLRELLQDLQDAYAEKLQMTVFITDLVNVVDVLVRMLGLRIH